MTAVAEKASRVVEEGIALETAVLF